jgi:hypothetical protein
MATGPRARDAARRAPRSTWDAGAQTAILGLSDADGPESVARFGEVIAAFR